MVRPPWSRRRTEGDITDFFVRREGVPDGLFWSLIEFVTRCFYVYDEFGNSHYPNAESVQQFARITDRYLPRHPDEAAKQFEADRNFLLDAVDFALGHFHSSSYQAETVAELNSQLAEARSAYVAAWAPTVGTNCRTANLRS